MPAKLVIVGREKEKSNMVACLCGFHFCVEKSPSKI